MLRLFTCVSAFVALLSLSASAQDLSTCKKICEVQKLVEEGPFLGIRFSVLPNTTISLVKEVIPNTAAANFGLEVYDLILELDGKSPKTNQELIDLVGSHKPGDIVSIVYSRKGVVHRNTIRIGAKSSRMVTVKECCDDNLITADTKQINFYLSPNPADTKLTIRADQAIDGDVQVKIFDVTGKIVGQFQKSNRGAFAMPLDVTSYTNGEYIAKINSKNSTYTARFIVSH